MLRNVPDRGDIIRSLPQNLRDKLFPPPPPPDIRRTNPRLKKPWEDYWDPTGNPIKDLPDWPQQYTPTGGGFKPAENISDIMNPTASGGGIAQAPAPQPAAAAPQPVTGHAASPWGASISDFFNNDNWTRQYEGTNPRSGEPISVGNWYTPGGGSSVPTNNRPVSAGYDPLKISPFSGPFQKNRFNPGAHPWESGPGAPMKPEGQAYWNSNRVGVEPIEPVPTGPELHQGVPELTWQDKLKQGGQSAVDYVGSGIGNAVDYVSDSGVGQAIGDGLGWRPEPTTLSQNGVMPNGSSTLGQTYFDGIRISGIIDKITNPNPPFGEDKYSAERAIFQQLMAADPTMRPSFAAKEAAFTTGRLPRPAEGASEDQGSNFYMDNIHNPINKYFAGGAGQRGWQYIKDLTGN